MQAYEQMIRATSTPAALGTCCQPTTSRSRGLWSAALVEGLERLDLRFPEVGRAQLEEIMKRLRTTPEQERGAAAFASSDRRPAAVGQVPNGLDRSRLDRLVGPASQHDRGGSGAFANPAVQRASGDIFAGGNPGCQKPVTLS